MLYLGCQLRLASYWSLRPGASALFQGGPAWRDHLLVNEYFDGDTGEGLGAHQIGWTALAGRVRREPTPRADEGFPGAAPVIVQDCSA